MIKTVGIFANVLVIMIYVNLQGRKQNIQMDFKKYISTILFLKKSHRQVKITWISSHINKVLTKAKLY